MESLEAARDAVADAVKFDILTPNQAIENEKHFHSISRSFLSDTVTAPTPEMYQYAIQASIGDDVFNEPCTQKLERHVAQLAGKEAGLFVPSGTMSNQLAMRTHLTQPPHSVLLDIRAHIHKYEAGGVAYHNGAAVIPVIPSNGHHLTLQDVKNNIVLGEEIHSATTRVIALENTLNGTILPQEEIVAIGKFAKENGVKLHLDGARIWHVAAETGTPICELLEPFDSVSMCFSKGLGAPIGSMLVGSSDFIKRARWLRKLFGGGMRQTGFMVASAAYALTHNFEKLHSTHSLAKKLEKGLAEIGIKITSPAETCMVFFDPAPVGLTYPEIIDRASRLPDPIHLYGSRLVVHIQTSAQAVEDLLTLLQDMVEEKQKQHPDGVLTNGNGTAEVKSSGYQEIYVRDGVQTKA